MTTEVLWMENNLTANQNDKISEQLRAALMGSDKLMKDICAQEEGYIDIFIRKGDISLLSYRKLQIDSTSLDYEGVEDKEDNSEFPIKKKFETVPPQIYRRFAYILSSAVLYTPVMEHGHIFFNFKFIQSDNEQWQEEFTMEFHEEIPFRNGVMMAKYQ